MTKAIDLKPCANCKRAPRADRYSREGKRELRIHCTCGTEIILVTERLDENYLEKSARAWNALN